MKKVFLIGDSIRFGLSGEDKRKFGYGTYVKEKLNGKVEVYQPDDNCRFLQYTLRYLHEWANKIENREEIDVVHWNNGLWDCLRLFGDEPFTPIEMYKQLLPRVYKRIHMLFPNAIVIFALSTPVSEELSSRDFTRKNTDIIAYNKAAVDVLTPLGVQINDLYSTAKEIRSSMYLDWVHYNEEGSQILANRVISAIYEAFEKQDC